MEFSRPHVINEATIEYLNTLDPKNPPNPETIAETILTVTTEKCREVNATRSKGETKWRLPTELTEEQVARILATLYPVKRLSYLDDPKADNDYILGLYQTEGENKGIYTVSDLAFKSIIKQYNNDFDDNNCKKVKQHLESYVETTGLCRDKDLVAVNNGIFNYATKELLDFDPNIVFISKSHVDYNPNAQNIPIRNDDGTYWNVEDWMKSLSDDPEIVALLWEILSAIIRPNVRWNKSAWLYSEQGNNGKGTLCELMRELSGKSAYTSIPIALFSKDFMLEPLLSVSAIIVDENDVGDYIDRSANLKAVITNDVIFVNRKFQKPLSIQYRGFMVQCINELPKLRDRSQSMLRRLLIVPMLKCFTGHERKYIKNDYLHRKDVLEYVMYRVLNSNFYELSEPHACKELLGDYRIYNNPVEDFWHQFRDLFVWDLLPYEFLYELYKSYINVVNPQSSVMGRNTFTRELRAVVLNDPTQKWIAPPNPRIRGDHMNCIEDLIVQYQLYSFCRNCQIATKPTSIISDQEKKKSYRGLVRNKSRLNP